MAIRKSIAPTAAVIPPAPRQPSSARPRSAKTAPRRRVKVEPAPVIPQSVPRRLPDRWRDVARIAVIAAALALILLVIKNGPAGAAVTGAVGWSAYLLPVAAAAVGLEILRRAEGARPWPRFEETNGLLLLYLAVLLACGGWRHGGTLGNSLAGELTGFLGAAGVPVIAVCLLALGLVLAAHVTARHFWLASRWAARRGVHGGGKTAHALIVAGKHVSQLQKTSSRSGGPLAGFPSVARVDAASALALVPPSGDDDDGPGSTSALRRKRARPTEPERELPLEAEAEQEQSEAPLPLAVGGDWALPAVDLLDSVPLVKDTTPIDTGLRMRVIEDTLGAFNVKARVTGFHSGPTVTQFDVQPERGVRVQRVTALQNDLALALAARSIRIQAPVPGQSVIGIEIPNAKPSVVTLREVLESEQCAEIRSPLKIALGKDVSGVPVLADLARMPHLLIAGSTGSGKSVCLNSLISCLLFHNSPERLRLLMVDPKMVELTVFNDVPHLLAPVVTDVTKVTGTLKWALKEMHRRYKKFSEVKARNLARFNEMQTDPKKRLPFIVLIIDELADLMMVSPEDVEDGICRLAQLARATGMHLVLATQRPSVDVITGLIKANFPARIAFAVSSQVDSRTILDQAGAEKLMGRGDMLYQPSDEGKPIRVQGTYLSDKEIESLVAYWKQHGHHDLEKIPDAELEPPAKDEESDSDDKLLRDAVKVLREYNRASVSLLQRRLSIGYTRAARLLDTLEDRGIVGPSEDGRSRIVLATRDVELDDGDGGGDDVLPL
ncbi:MAG TPA: DNA translocase FtsK [Chloroflexota bacterium]|nr:DNA translocase FtsK [Chloroflexota bacterium]